MKGEIGPVNNVAMKITVRYETSTASVKLPNWYMIEGRGCPRPQVVTVVGVVKVGQAGGGGSGLSVSEASDETG